MKSSQLMSIEQYKKSVNSILFLTPNLETEDEMNFMVKSIEFGIVFKKKNFFMFQISNLGPQSNIKWYTQDNDIHC